MANPLQALIQTPSFARLRRNHGLEHATIHVLSRKYPRVGLAGHSSSSGFRIFADLDADQVLEGVETALGRLRAGERGLAIHPNCGTNLVTSGMAAGVAGAIAMAGSGPRSRDRLERLPLAGLLATAALLLARPLGTRLQQYVTTSGDPGDLEILDIQTQIRAGLTAHRVTTRS
jgi:hypothetical protein